MRHLWFLEGFLRHLWFLECFRRKQLISKLISSMSQGIKSQSLPKQRKIVIVRLQQTIKN